MFYTTLIICSLTASLAFAGFKNGDSLLTSPIEGTATVRCDGFNGRQTSVYNCRDIVLEPGAYDVFVGPQHPTAYSVSLKAIHEDGSSRNKQELYNGSLGVSSDSFNLWISTLFQRPLLEFGKNTILWEITNREDKVLESGEFLATVKKGPARKCDPAFFNSTDANDCNSQFTVCQRYFEQQNYCH
jgi:hypothetical protein